MIHFETIQYKGIMTGNLKIKHYIYNEYEDVYYSFPYIGTDRVSVCIIKDNKCKCVDFIKLNLYEYLSDNIKHEVYSKPPNRGSIFMKHHLKYKRLKKIDKFIS